jgi:hypothetical protein
VIPHPPFASQLTLEEELATFERLKPRLARVWDLLVADSSAACTTVVVPSLTLEAEGLRQLEGALTAVGNSHSEVDELYRRTLAVLEQETGYG